MISVESVRCDHMIEPSEIRAKSTGMQRSPEESITVQRNSWEELWEFNSESKRNFTEDSLAVDYHWENLNFKNPDPEAAFLE